MSYLWLEVSIIAYESEPNERIRLRQIVLQDLSMSALTQVLYHQSLLSKTHLQFLSVFPTHFLELSDPTSAYVLTQLPLVSLNLIHIQSN